MPTTTAATTFAGDTPPLRAAHGDETMGSDDTLDLDDGGDRAAQRRVYGSDPSVDAASLGGLAAMRVEPGKGFDTDSVNEFRRAALNTVDYLETVVERLSAERDAMSAKLAYPLTMPAMARGVAALAVEMRKGLGEGDLPARRWLAAQVSAILTADPASSDQAASALGGLVADLMSSRPGCATASVAAGEWAGMVAGEAAWADGGAW